MTDRSAFDLFAGLSSIGRKNHSWYESLSAAGQKAAAPLVMARWLSGTSDTQQIVHLNRYVNPYLFSGSADKSALFKLMAASCTGKNSRFSWLKGPGAKTKKMSIDVVKQYYDCSTREAVTYKIAGADLLEMAEELGWDKDETTKLKKELDDGPGTATRDGAKPAKRASERARKKN